MIEADKRDAAREAMVDRDAVTARESLVERLAGGFHVVDARLRVAGTLVGFGSRRADGSPGDDRLVGMGYVAGAAVELLRGVRTLVGVGNAYGAAALARQLVEIEYLAWAFAEDQDEASAWLVSSHEDRLERWQPRHLRERAGGRFRGKDYALHCERGGHPTPVGCRMLLGGDSSVSLYAMLLEAALHGSSAWRYLLAAVDRYADQVGCEASALLPPKDRKPSLEEIDHWRTHDPMLQFRDLVPIAEL